MTPTTRASLLIVGATVLAAVCVWVCSRLLAASATPLWFALPGLGLALAYVLARAGLEARERTRR